jgi:hypothetical protein
MGLLFLRFSTLGGKLLKALARYVLRNEGQQTISGHSSAQLPPSAPPPDYVTRDELDAIMGKFEKQMDFELGEWFDKFSALHARTEKRVNRDRANKGNGPVQVEQPAHLPSILSLRKPWSV